MPAQPSAAVAAALDAAARSFGVPRDVLYGIAATESNFDPTVIGDQGQSFGLLQVQLATAQGLGFGATPQDLLDPGTNANAGAAYLRAQLQRFQGNLVAAVSAYNAGAGGVMSNSRYIQQVATTATEFAQQWGMRAVVRCERAGARCLRARRGAGTLSRDRGPARWLGMELTSCRRISISAPTRS